jgi:hypothetical protein
MPGYRRRQIHDRCGLDQALTMELPEGSLTPGVVNAHPEGCSPIIRLTGPRVGPMSGAAFNGIEVSDSALL